MIDYAEVHNSLPTIPVFRVGALVLCLLAGCASPATGTDTASLTHAALQPVNCTDVSDTCAKQYIGRSSACAQLSNTGSGQADDASRQCAESNYEAALAHAPMSGGENTRTKSLIGLAESLKEIRDNARVQSDQIAAQRKLNVTLNALMQQQGGQPYAQYFRADSLVAETRTQALAPADVCARLREARESLPTTGDNDSNSPFNVRVNRLRNTIDDYTQQRSCQQ
jgi:hypothetical protein